VPATSAGPDGQGQQQQQVAPRKLLLILHGKRIEDDQVRDAIKQLKDEGHEVMAAAASWSSAGVCLGPMLDKLWQQTIKLHAANKPPLALFDTWMPLNAASVQVVVRVTWDSGDVDQFVKEAVELWDSQR
jgi:hypothetical protein